MSRNHRQLRVFGDARQLTLAIYGNTNDFPRDEWFGMRLQIRRAAVSVGTNIVEGSARRTTREYCNFLNIALGSASELAYLLEVASELGFVRSQASIKLCEASSGLVRQLQRLVDEEARSPKPEA